MKTCFTLIVIFTISSSSAQDYGAGVMPYRVGDEGEIYILFGLESGFWEDFIGGYEKFDGGDLIETATREFHQETNCYFERDELRELIYKQRENVVEIKPKVYRFIIEIQNVNPSKIRSYELACVEGGEKEDWIWLKLSEIEKAINKSKTDLDVIVAYGIKKQSVTLDKKMKRGLLPNSETIKFLKSIQRKD